MNRAEKNELKQSLLDKFSKANLAVFADFRGLTANRADEFRKQIRLQNGEVQVLKNNVARLAAKDGHLGEDAKKIMDNLVGPTMVAFHYGDPVTLSKVIQNFSKDNEAFQLKDSLLEKKKISPAAMEELAKLPSKQILVAMLLGVLNAPIRNFVGVLAAVPRSLVTVLAAIEQKKKDSAQ